MTKLLFTLGVIALWLSLGYTIQRLVASQRLILPLPIADVRRLLQKVGLLFFMYFSFMATVWITRIDNPRLVALPAIGLFISNACWLTSTLALFGMLPIVYVLIQHL